MENLEQYIEDYLNTFVSWLPSFALAAVVLIVGMWVIKRINRILEKNLHRVKMDDGVSQFLRSFLDILLKITLLLIAASIIGFQTSALIGLLAAAGFAVGMALQGFLGNFASGLTIIFFKPYSVGDWVDIGDKFGKVESIQIFNTILRTPNNKKLVVPNGQVTEHIITNLSDKGFIRLELNILVGYEESYPKLEKIIRESLRDCQFLIEGQETLVGIESYDTHNINLAVRPAVNPDQYWEAVYDCHARIKRAFNENGIKMAYSEGVELGPIGS